MKMYFSHSYRKYNFVFLSLFYSYHMYYVYMYIYAIFMSYIQYHDQS